ncbi:MAG TPA: DUF4019 domain-containing protein [Rhizomicrobium sp.]
MAKLINKQIFCFALFVLSASTTVHGQDTSKPAQPMRVINLTSDSAPGWRPSVEQSTLVEKTARDYFAAKDADRTEDAYRYLAKIDAKDQPFDQYAADLKKFNAQSGPVIERRLIKVTWTKDPQQAPMPGVYAAIDMASRFANIDRHCGYVVLYQEPAGGGFSVMREESNFIDNSSAAGIERVHGAASLDQMWAQLSSNCPNYSDPA